MITFPDLVRHSLSQIDWLVFFVSFIVCFVVILIAWALIEAWRIRRAVKADQHDDEQVDPHIVHTTRILNGTTRAAYPPASARVRDIEPRGA